MPEIGDWSKRFRSQVFTQSVLDVKAGLGLHDTQDSIIHGRRLQSNMETQELDFIDEQLSKSLRVIQG